MAEDLADRGYLKQAWQLTTSRIEPGHLPPVSGSTDRSGGCARLDLPWAPADTFGRIDDQRRDAGWRDSIN